ncbi:hypothetical protein HMPREF1594_04770 [Escherichia coli 907446]|nr:hypothetical protein HMPREF1594_04770 [Escherichia coli 907446]
MNIYSILIIYLYLSQIILPELEKKSSNVLTITLRSVVMG